MLAEAEIYILCTIPDLLVIPAKAGIQGKRLIQLYPLVEITGQ
jgi:hypothetical protein